MSLNQILWQVSEMSYLGFAPVVTQTSLLKMFADLTSFVKTDADGGGGGRCSKESPKKKSQTKYKHVDPENSALFPILAVVH